MNSGKVICPKCGTVIETAIITHAAAVAWGKIGGHAGRGARKRRAAIRAAKIRWARQRGEL